MRSLALAATVLLPACSSLERHDVDEPSFQYIAAKGSDAGLVFDRRTGCMAQVSFSEHHTAVGAVDATASSKPDEEKVPKFDPDGEWDSYNPITTMTNFGDWKCPGSEPASTGSAKK